MIGEHYAVRRHMSKTALVAALRTFDLAAVRALLEARPALRDERLDRGFNLLQFCCARSTLGDAAAAARQLKLAQWLVKNGFDARATYTFPAGADGEAEPAEVSLVWFAVARAQNNRLARYLLEQGAAPGALFAAAWLGNADIVPDLVRHGADLNEPVEGSTPLHMAVEVVQRGTADKPALARQRRAVLEHMLSLGADPNLPNAKGLTPLGVAAKKRHDAAIVDLLKKYGGKGDAG
jgi:hypothetical protein